MYMNTYIRIHISIYVYICIHIYIYMYMYIFIYIYIHKYIYLYIYIYTRICRSIQIYVYAYVYIYIYVYDEHMLWISQYAYSVCLHVCAYSYDHLCMFVCVCARFSPESASNVLCLSKRHRSLLSLFDRHPAMSYVWVMPHVILIYDTVMDKASHRLVCILQASTAVVSVR